MTLEASVTFVASTNIQYLHTLLREEALHQFDKFVSEVGSTTSETLKSIILGWGTYCFPVNSLLKKLCDAPKTEESARFKSKMLRFSYD